MGIAILGILGVIVLVASISSNAGAATVSTTPKKTDLKALMKRAKERNATLAELRAGSAEAKERGLPKISLMLGYYADFLRERKMISSEVKNVVSTSLPSSFQSALKGLPSSAWSAYVNKQKSAKAGFISPGYQLGIFMTGMRLLEDFGVVSKTYKGDYKGRKAWLGDWKEPYSLREFLNNAKLQYKIFAQQSKRDSRAIIKRHKKWLLGPKIEGQQASLSGLLAVAKQAGLAGLKKWLDGDRKDSTTRVYKRFNGIF